MQFVDNQNFLGDQFLNEEMNSNQLFPYESSISQQEENQQQDFCSSSYENNFDLFPSQQQQSKYVHGNQFADNNNQVKQEIDFENHQTNDINLQVKMQGNNNDAGIFNDTLSFTEGNEFNDLASTQEFYYSDQNIENTSKQEYQSDVYQNQSFQLKREYENNCKAEFDMQAQLQQEDRFQLSTFNQQEQFPYQNNQQVNLEAIKQQKELNYLNNYRKQLELEEKLRQKEIQKRKESNQPISSIKLFDLSFLHSQNQQQQKQTLTLGNVQNINDLRNDISNQQQQVSRSSSSIYQSNFQASSLSSSQINFSNTNMTKKIKRVKLNHKNQIASAETKNVPATVGNVLLNKLKEKLPDNQEIQKTQKVKNILDLKKLFTLSPEVQKLCLRFLQSGPMISYVSSSTRIKQKRLVIKYLDVIIQGCLDPSNFGCFKNQQE
ncbi:hypothetical protein PPERSA_09862 [Pseudocohnilembus persalinus]|uniref:Uncharacterized protein n=1 Tax=Pseudocohnilembus persalinus TaxID=266149 RepID=A0A0V0QUK8_PSEPJ|nr:hypothetical protein PPERSA_09862 [Pseudocohnilembus persalinus]|eukprot:KRX05722.1 hypothetical protein PPERSA_09862 [Pseudocohnilembus persalinus]